MIKYLILFTIFVSTSFFVPKYATAQYSENDQSFAQQLGDEGGEILVEEESLGFLQGKIGKWLMIICGVTLLVTLAIAEYNLALSSLVLLFSIYLIRSFGLTSLLVIFAIGLIAGAFFEKDEDSDSDEDDEEEEKPKKKKKSSKSASKKLIR